jgi:hypothetical protein
VSIDATARRACALPADVLATARARLISYSVK